MAVTSRLIVEQFDPMRPKPGGIDTCIRGLIKFSPKDEVIRVAGVDAIGDKRLGVWETHNIGGREFQFMAVARLDHANLSRSSPHSFHLARGLKKYIPEVNVDVVQTHRINVGDLVMRHYKDVPHVQFMHSSGQANLGKGSVSFFRYAKGLYRLLERRVVARSRSVIIFSSSGANRLQDYADNVYFSPTWFDPSEFFPNPYETLPKKRILWACRIEPAKNPELAMKAFSELPSDYELTVAGDGTLMQSMRALSTELGLSSRVKFLGAVPKGEMGVLMREHDLLMMSSRFEGYSRSVVEALASGLLIATTPGGEPNELVLEGRNGARSASDDSPELLAKAVERAANLSSSGAVSSARLLSAIEIVPELLSR